MWLCVYISLQNKWTLSLKPSHVHLRFFDLVDNIILLLFTTDKICFNFANKCRSLMVSDTQNIPLFTDPFLSKLINCRSIFLLKILLLPFLSWLDHSILKELTSNNDSVTHLLTQFNSLIDANKPLTAYPIPTLSQLMIPLDDKFTIVATKSLYNLENISLKYVVNIKATITEQWKITKHAIQLIAISTELNYLYWMVPICVVPVIISSNNYESQHHFRQQGILMTAILPDLFFTGYYNITQLLTGGPFSSLIPHDDMVCTY